MSARFCAAFVLALTLGCTSKLGLAPTLPLTPTPDDEFRRSAPAVESRPALSVPAGRGLRLGNGLELWVVERPWPSVVTLSYASRTARDPLGGEDVGLAKLTNPGPFGMRTLELGEYFGYFDGGRLVAMAGERMSAGTLREVSGICTHPDVQGRGLAKKLTLKLVRRQRQRGETPYLHVMSHNATARGLYERMGFRNYLETTVRVITKL